MWATGICSRTRQRQCRRGYRAAGFTLLEMLVVLVIMGLVSGLAMLGWPDALVARGDRALERLQARMTLAADASAMFGRSFGLVLTPGHYRFVEYRGADQWTKPSMQDLQGTVMLVGRPALSIGGRTVPVRAGRMAALETSASAFGTGAGPASSTPPVLWTDEFGEWPAFELRLLGDAGGQAALSSTDGKLQVAQRP